MKKKKKKEKTEDLRLKKNPHHSRDTRKCIPRFWGSMKDNPNFLNDLCTSIDIDASKVKSCSGLGKTLEEKDNIESQTWPLRITLESTDDVDLFIKNVSLTEFCKRWTQEPENITRQGFEEEKKCQISFTKSKTLDCRGFRKIHTKSQRGQAPISKEKWC